LNSRSSAASLSGLASPIGGTAGTWLPVPHMLLLLLLPLSR
jgi:hypothetical protein